MAYKPGDSYVGEFTLCNPTTGAASNGDTLPTGTVVHNGTDDGTVTVTVTNIATGRYKATATIPVGYASGDSVQVVINATVATVAGVAVIDSFVLDSKRLSDITTGNLVNANTTQIGGNTCAAADAVSGYIPVNTVQISGTAATLVSSVDLNSTGLDNIVVETGINARQALSIITAALSGVLAGGGTTTITIAAANHSTTNRITATVDASGNRSALTLNLPA